MESPEDFNLPLVLNGDVSVGMGNAVAPGTGSDDTGDTGRLASAYNGEKTAEVTIFNLYQKTYL